MSYLDLILFAFLLVVLAHLKLNHGTAFDRDTTASLRGIAMVGIMLHHIQVYVPAPSHILGSIGYLATGLFFFISGYGNTLSLSKKKNIDYNWIIGKFLKIYIPFIVTYILYVACNVLVYSENMKCSDMIRDIITVSLPRQVSWFPKVILLCFAVHYIAKRMHESKNIQIAIIAVSIFGFVGMAYFAGIDVYWYNSVVCYPAGCIIALRKSRSEMHTKKKIMLLFVSVVAFLVSYLIARKVWLVSLICSLCFSVMCFVVSMIITAKTKALSFIGNNSFEYYLFHVLALKLFMFTLPISHYAYTCSVIIGTSIIVFVYVRIKNINKSRQC